MNYNTANLVQSCISGEKPLLLALPIEGTMYHAVQYVLLPPPQEQHKGWVMMCATLSRVVGMLLCVSYMAGLNLSVGEG